MVIEVCYPIVMAIRIQLSDIMFSEHYLPDSRLSRSNHGVAKQVLKICKSVVQSSDKISCP